MVPTLAEETEMKTNRKKLRLDVDELKVEAFATADRAAKNGTVHGYGVSISCLTQCASDCGHCPSGISCVTWCDSYCGECPIPSDSGPIPCLCLPPMSANGEC
jgi:hypothetical protein